MKKIRLSEDFYFWLMEKCGEYSENYKRKNDDYEYGISINEFIRKYPYEAKEDAINYYADHKDDHLLLLTEWKRYTHYLMLKYKKLNEEVSKIC